MSAFTKSIDACLGKMQEIGGTEKGSFGEQAVFKACEAVYQKEGGILYHSYTFPVTKTKAGNIKVNDQGNLMIENLGSSTEIDVLLITKYRVIPIEVKAYKAKTITLTDDKIAGCYKTNKSPVHQNEMHARHLYEQIFRALPEGKSMYIRPIVVFVDNCTLKDSRTNWQKEYIPVTTLDGFTKTLRRVNTPGDYLLDLSAMNRALTEACMKSEQCLPLRIK